MNTVPSPIPGYVMGLLRTIGAGVGGWLVAKGYITADQLPELGGAAMLIAAALWSLAQKKLAHQDLKAAIAAPAQPVT